MHKYGRTKLCALATVAVALGVTGCFGDNILSAGAKIAGGQISQLTAGEIKVLNQTAIGLLAASNPGFNPEPLTDAQASALSTFFQANNLNTFEDFETLEETATNNPESLEGLDELETAFAGTDYEDGENFDFSSILDTLLGGLGGGTGIVGPGGGGTNTANSNSQS